MICATSGTRMFGQKLGCFLDNKDTIENFTFLSMFFCFFYETNKIKISQLSKEFLTTSLKLKVSPFK